MIMDGHVDVVMCYDTSIGLVGVGDVTLSWIMEMMGGCSSSTSQCWVRLLFRGTHTSGFARDLPGTGFAGGRSGSIPARAGNDLMVGSSDVDPMRK